MYYFMEITCLPDEGVPVEFILGKVMDALHLAFVKLQQELGYNPIGISFPEYRYQEERRGKVTSNIGGKIRLFSREDAHLHSLKLTQVLQRLADYVHIRSLSSLDRPTLRFATFQRVQAKSSRERLLRRHAQRSGQDLAVLTQQYQEFTEERLQLPFIHLRSHSNQQAFRIFIRKEPATASESWQFGTYGLSRSVAVPDF